MSGVMRYLTTLELQILLINVLGLAGSTFNWSWLKWDQQFEKIWNLSVSQSNELDAKNVNWLKNILSWIVGARFVIGHVSLLAYGANIYTIIARSWQNLLIFWMVLSFLKDIVLEVVVIVITFLLWYKGNISTSLFAEFIAEKTVRLFVATYKWCTTLKWHTQLRKVEKIRKFTVIAQRSIANIVHAPGKVKLSLEDEYLSPAIARRNKYASLLNLDVLSDELFSRVNFDLRASKSLTTLATNDSHDSNDANNHDPIVNDLSVAEKSMKMLNITAEDVMDARARIQERPYWNEQDVISETMEEVMAQFSLDKVEEKIDDVDHILKEEDPVQDHPTEKKRKKDDFLTDINDEILNRKQEENILLVKNIMPKKMKKKVETAVKIVQCPSKENMEAKPCASFVRKLETKFCFISVSQKEKEVNQKMHPCQVKTKSTSASPSLNEEEFDKSSETLCACRHVSRNIYTSKNRKNARSIDINDKSVKHDIDKKEFKHLVSTGVTQKDKVKTMKYSEIYRLKKQIKKSEDFFRKQSVTWESMSLARTAHFSGYAKNIVATDKISISPTKTFNESSDSLNARCRIKYIEHTQSGTSVDLRSIFKIASKRKNYTESETYNDLTLLENKRRTKMKKISNCKLLIEEDEALERGALRICNELTLLEDKKELEELEKKHNLSSNHKQTIKVSEMKVLGAGNDLMLLRNRKEMETRRLNLSPSYEQSIEESNTLKTRNKLAKSTRELQATKIHNQTKYEASSKYEEDVETSNVSNFSEVNHEDTTISLFETHRNANACTLLNPREITRNIEWTIHPRGITLINKNLYSQFLENGRFHESRQRDIVDDNTANTLHSAFFFKPEITTRIFRRAQTRIGESFPNIPTFLREDFNTEFVCCVNNEIIVRDHLSFFDLDFERIMGDENNLQSSRNSENRVVEEEENHDSCTIFADPEQVSIESETGIENSTEVIGLQEDARSSMRNIQTRNISIFDENHEQVDNGTSDNLPIQSIIQDLKKFYIEVPEDSIYDTTLPIEQLEEQGNMSHAIGDSFQKLNKNNESFDQENNNEHYKILDHNVNIDKTINDQSEQADDSATSSLSDNNHQFNMLINKRKKIRINRITENPSKLSLPGPSFIESDNNEAILKSSEEKFQKLTQLSDSETTLENRRSKSILNLGIANDDTILQFGDVEILKSKAMQNSARSEEDKEMIYEKANELPASRFFRMSLIERLQDDSFYSTYERNDNRSNTPVSLENGSLMEEFSSEIIAPEQSDSVANNSRHFQ